MMSTENNGIFPSWGCEEFSGIDLGDVRLNRRLMSVADALVSHPSSTINAVCEDWSSVKAAYRLFDFACVCDTRYNLS